MPGAEPCNGLEWRPYVYRGAGVDTLTPPDLQARLDEQFGPDEMPWPHGTITGYGRGCRCQPCMSVESARKRRWRQGRAAA
jgi:hypothetical protein